MGNFKWLLDGIKNKKLLESLSEGSVEATASCLLGYWASTAGARYAVMDVQPVSLVPPHVEEFMNNCTVACRNAIMKRARAEHIPVAKAICRSLDEYLEMTG